MMHHPFKYLSILMVFCFVGSNHLAASEFEQWLQNQASDYEAYQQEQDKAFSNFLKKEWRSFQVDQQMIRDGEPKPIVMPVAPPSDTPVEPVSVQPVEIKTIPKPVAMPVAKPQKLQPRLKGKRLRATFYGVPIDLYYDERLSTHLGRRINNDTISQFWDRLSRTDFAPLKSQLEQYRDKLQLNDWGYAMLLDRVGKSIYAERKNEALLFVWFALNKSGYDARIGFGSQRVFLMLPSKKDLFGKPFFTYDGEKYYVFNFDGEPTQVKNLFSYDGRYPGADQLFDMSLTQPPKIKSLLTQRQLEFEFDGKTHQLDVTYDRSIVNYFDTYPVTELDVYFNATASEQLTYSLLSSLKPLLDGLSEERAVNLLLRFVQTAFEYKTDGDQFGREKYFFAEELFFYPFSDCEDRSVLFAFLVQSLLGLDVVALSYPGHVATAVYLNDVVDGASVMYQGKKYIVADPTYINANVGAVMPRYASIRPEIVPVIAH